ncbi:MAG TPA: hypothetical protein VFE33_19315 [Thermoanaerobaculia bacterium]|nr:hypothetical protein [Thermoanaerobaculia bacterium]
MELAPTTCRASPAGTNRSSSGRAGTIRVAHTPEERVPKRQLEEAVGLYRDLVLRLLHDPPRR